MQICPFDGLAAVGGFHNAHGFAGLAAQLAAVDDKFSLVHTFGRVAVVFIPQWLVGILLIGSILQTLMLALLLWKLSRLRRQARRFISAAALLAVVWLISKNGG